MELTIVFAVLAVSVVLFVTEVIPIDVTALVILGSLVATGVLTPEEGVRGFSNPAPLTVAPVLVRSHGHLYTGCHGGAGRLGPSLD